MSQELGDEGMEENAEQQDENGEDPGVTEKAFEDLGRGASSEENPQVVESEAGTGEPPVIDLQQQVADKEDQLLRAAAEIENVRKRGRREIEETRKYASSGLLMDLLTVVDDLNRAVEAAEANEESSGLLAGVKMVSSQLESVLEKNHCRRIVALGEPFDPNLHEAIQMQPSDQYEANLVSLEARTGFQLHDRVLRTAQVFVSTGQASPGENGE